MAFKCNNVEEMLKKPSFKTVALHTSKTQDHADFKGHALFLISTIVQQILKF